jgi:hypothetical protein
MSDRKSTPEYKRVREEIAKKYCGHNSKIGFILADRILAIRGIAILADSQTLPHGLTARLNLPDLEHYLYAESALNKTHFKKVVE